MRTALQLMTRLVTVVITVLMVVMLTIVNSTVVTRYFFSYSPPWKEEMTNYCMVWMVMLGAGILTLFDDHIALYMAVDKLSPRGRYWQSLVAKLVVLVSSIIIVWTGFIQAFREWDVIATGLRISMFWPTVAVPVGALMIAVFSALLIVKAILEKLGGVEVQLPDQADFMDSSFKCEE